MPDDVLNGILDSASDDQSANSTGRTPLVIDSDLRTINVPTDYVFGVQNDQDVLTVPFVVPRYCDGVDLSELSIRINFTTKSGLSSYYDVIDKTVNTDTIEFAWLLGAAVFVSVGDLTFAVCIRKVEADGRITKEFNTTLATAKILPGLTVEDQKDPTQYSILVQMQNLADRVNSTIEDAEEYAEQLRNYVGAPLVATAASDMTDQNRIYVYVGNENGYNNGHWYYYQSLTWHDGGTYNSPTAGDYPDIYAGNVISDRCQMDSTPYLFRPTGGGLQRIGERCYPVLVGASVAENQLINPSLLLSGSGNGITVTADTTTGEITVSGTATANTSIVVSNTTLEVKNGHVYYLSQPQGASTTTFWLRTGENTFWNYKRIGKSTNETVTSNLRAYVASGQTVNFKIKPQFIDLSLLLPSNISDYAYTLEQATAGAGIAKLREWGFLTGGYIPYNAGTLESVEATAHKMVGFNQFDGEWESGTINSTTGAEEAGNYRRSKNYIRVLPNTVYYGHADATFGLRFYDANKNYITNGVVANGDATFTTLGNAYYLRLVESTSVTENICINLSSDRNGEYEPYREYTYDLGTDTLRGLFKLDANNNLYADGDRKTADGTITRKYAEIVLNGTESYSINVGTDRNRIAWNGYEGVGKTNGVFVSDKLTAVANASGGYGTAEWQIFGSTAAARMWITVPSSIATANDFKTYVTQNPITVVYELATPTTEQSTPFTSPQICYPDGTEEFVTENGVPAGHETKYPYDIKTQAERLIDVPDVPSTNGTYVLKATRSSSGLTYTWVAG